MSSTPSLPGKDAARAGPGLAEYARSVWRRKLLVTAGLLLGAVAGLLGLPRFLPTNPRYQASEILTVRDLRLGDLLSSSSGGGRGSTAGQTTLPADPDAVKATIDDLGPRAGRLRALRGVPAAKWRQTLAGSLAATSVSGLPDSFTVAYADDDPDLAQATLVSYVAHLTAKRNGAFDGEYDDYLASLERRSAQEEATYQQLVGRAKRERIGPSAQPSTATVLQIQHQEQVLSDLERQIDDLTRARRFTGEPVETYQGLTLDQQASQLGRGLALALGLLLGLLAAVGLAFVLEAYAPKVLTAADVEQATGLGVLGEIPRVARRQRTAVAVLERPFSPASEAYRRIVTALERRGLGSSVPGTSVKVLAVLSADAHEGKSTLAVNLACTLARQGRNVALVSSDLRRPGVEQLLRLPATDGLAAYLQGDRDDLMSLCLSVGDNLIVLPAGAPTSNPAELLAGRRLATAVKTLRANGLIVVLDTPPARWSADAMLLAAASDATLLVTRAGRGSSRGIQQVAEGLRREGLRTLGAVLLGETAGQLTRWRRYGSYYSAPAAADELLPRATVAPLHPEQRPDEPPPLHGPDPADAAGSGRPATARQP